MKKTLSLEDHITAIREARFARAYVAGHITPTPTRKIPISSFVYFIESGTDGPIKIGFTYDLTKRLLDLQSANPSKLKLLAGVTGSKTDEARLHRYFTSSRIHGEWFQRTPELIALIAYLNTTTPVGSVIPLNPPSTHLSIQPLTQAVDNSGTSIVANALAVRSKTIDAVVQRIEGHSQPKDR